MNMTVEFCGIKMKSPIIAASGTFGYGIEYKDYMDLNQVGAISVKGLGLTPWTGNKGVRIAETATRILEIMREQPTITVKKIADQMRLSVAGVRYHINKMKKDGLVEHVGPSKKGTWLLHDES